MKALLGVCLIVGSVGLVAIGLIGYALYPTLVIATLMFVGGIVSLCRK